jgi:pimeloyl-ACP methyl ester carboxylesterase
MKTVLLVPGHTEDLDSRGYGKLLKVLENKGYRVKFVPINWRYTYLDKWVEQLEEVYKACDPSQTTLAGFSFGAITVLAAAAKRNPAELWLFSLSPYFKEDLPGIKDSWKKDMGARKIGAFEKLDFPVLASQIHCRTIIFLGQDEADKYADSKRRAEEAHRLIKDSELVYIPGVGHDVADDRYITAIAKEA